MKTEDLEHLTGALSHIATTAYLVFAATLMADQLHYDYRARLRALVERFRAWKRRQEFEAFYRLWTVRHGGFSSE